MSHHTTTTAIARIALLAGVLLAIAILLSRSYLPTFAQQAPPPSTSTEAIDYDENGTDPVVVYTATDPEGEDVTWEVVDASDDSVSADSGDFSITNAGVLTFDSSPDFESPADEGRNNQYVVKVRASDATSNTHTVTVTVTVKNVNEPGTVAFSHPQPKEGTELTVTLTDPDGEPRDTATTPIPTNTNLTTIGTASTTWQWARSQSTSTGASWTDIANATTTSYTPVAADVGHYLRATAMYNDGVDKEGTNNTARGISANKVLVEEYINTPPIFPDHDDDTTGNQITMSVPEDESLGEGDAVGNPVKASDIGEDGGEEVLTYTITGDDTTSPDRALFTIDSASAQLKLADDANPILDFERDNDDDDSYVVQVTARDPSGLTSVAAVTINVTEVDEKPTIVAGGATVTYAEIENNSPNTNTVHTYTASDEDTDDTNDSLSWKLSGADASKFSITETGESGALTFKSPPDYEKPADSGRNNVYNVTIEVADDAGNKDTRSVAVTISNVDETATVELTSHPKPEVTRPISVKLNEPDGVSGSVSWQWSIGGIVVRTQSGGLTNSYTSATTTGTLGVSATYTDKGDGGSATVELGSPPSVGAKPTNNSAPTFSDTGTRTIEENTYGPVGSAVTASDSNADHDTLLYTLSGSDAAAFTLPDRTSGQIHVKSTDGLDFEAKSTYRVTVKATDPTGASKTQNVTITVTNLEESPRFTKGPANGAIVEYNENSTAVVATYEAKDDEDYKASPRIPLRWSVTPNSLFSIEGGKLKFKESPDYEALNNVLYNNDRVTVVITVADSSAGSENPTRSLVVEVINVDEAGEITGLPAQPKEEATMTVTLDDPDGPYSGDDSVNASASTTWQWFRSKSRTSGWALISATSTANTNVNTNTRTPEAADVGYYLRATAMYRDGQGLNKTTHGVTTRTVQAKEYVNSAPVFRDDVPDDPDNAATQGYQITMKVKEDNSLEEGDAVGDPVSKLVTDIGSAGTQEVLSYTLTLVTGDGNVGDEQGSFTIDSLSGQLKLAGEATLNYEAQAIIDIGREYQVRVKAIDPAKLSSTALVTIQIEDVDEAPVLADETTTANLTATTTLENSATTTLSSYAATDDDENNNGLKWSLSGADKDMFVLCVNQAVTNTCGDVNADNSDSNTVYLRFKPSNYEAPADSGRNNVYNVTVVATDSDDMTASRDVAVTVSNRNEAGVVTLSHIRPEVGTPIRASLTDPDGGVRSVTWKWAYCTNVSNNDCDNPTDIVGATSATYTPLANNAVSNNAHYLQATASYTDNATTTDTSSKTSLYTTQTSKDSNQPPVLPDVVQVRTVAENSRAGDSVGNPVTATDADDPIDTDNNNYLLYELTGTDAALFEIATGNTTPGQISVGEGTTLDYETKKTYSVTVRVTDPTRASDSVSVTINVTDVDEAPVVAKRGLTVTGPASVSYAEGGTDAVQTYNAVGPDSNGETWSLSGADAGDFSISSGGALSFRNTPDFEVPTDSDTDNVYNVTVKASLGTFSDDHAVTVTVTNVEEAGTVTLSPTTRPRVGTAITAALTDPDNITSANTTGSITTGVTWQWSKATATSSWSNISGATEASYTPADDDADNFLRATASYSGQSAVATTTQTVLALSATPNDGTVSLSPAQPVVGTAVTATLTDPDGTPTGLTWQWSWATTATAATSSWTNIPGATSASYTPVAADADRYLRATASYSDAVDGAGQTAFGTSANAVTTVVAVDEYDRNADGIIDSTEVLEAVADYFNGTLSATRVLEVVALYFLNF